MPASRMPASSTLPAKIYPTVCVCHSVVPLPSLSLCAAGQWTTRTTCYRACLHESSLIGSSGYSTPGLAQISLFRLPATISSSTHVFFLANCRTVTISKVLSEFYPDSPLLSLLQSPRAELHLKRQRQIFKIAMMDPYLLLLCRTYSNGKCRKRRSIACPIWASI